MKSEAHIKTVLETLKEQLRDRRKRQYDVDASLFYNTVQALEWVLNDNNDIFIRFPKGSIR